jgi:hypothetical protein
MLAFDLRLLLPIGVAAITFDGVMLKTISVIGVSHKIPLWLAFAIGLTVMAAAYLGEVATVRRQSSRSQVGRTAPRKWSWQ